MPGDAEKVQWERKGEGIKSLAPDTEVVENINKHKYVVASGCFSGALLCKNQDRLEDVAPDLPLFSWPTPCRFREEELFDDMVQWERKGDGIKPLPADTEVVANINDHR